ncbi:MAG: hypothetical protein MAG715_00995 [Methanonatronarchaeales archaeon]|nr:hypothetical protein [Methanonatronarchaeales archaeon]
MGIMGRKYLVDIPAHLARRTDALIDSGDYESVSAFARAAFENQLLLHASNEETILVDDAPDTGTAPTQESASDDEQAIDSWREALSLSKLNAESVETAEAEPITDGPIWGQFNKLLPIKIGVRGLAVLQSDEGGPVPLEEFRKIVGEQASQVRTHLGRLDDAQGRRRGEKMAAGLPDGSSEKSVRRYRNHFLGSLDSDGDMRGALAEMGFVRLYVDGDGEMASLTDAGLDFAEIASPVLDGKDEPTMTLSEDERKFLIRHMAENIPGEIEGMRQILDWIENGHNTPNKLNKKVATMNEEWSEKMAKTMRTGLLGRMYDLRLVEREWEGIRVTYSSKDQESLIASGEV